jgi:dinuclear metal center YbgI/SA1388 family protein
MTISVANIARCLEEFAPLAFQESYDNSGLIVGDPNMEVKKCLLSLDCTPEVVQEAIDKGCNMIISHHPIVFTGLKKMTGKSYVERAVILAIKNDVALYACHTNLDNVANGVNGKISEKLKLQGTRILHKKAHTLSKVAVYVPHESLSDVVGAMNKAGAGHIGNYDNCSFRTDGYGTYRPLEGANPRLGTIGKLEEVAEAKLELICPSHLLNPVIRAMQAAHPYEEVAYDVIGMANQWEMGSGMIGTLEEAMAPDDFLKYLKVAMDCQTIKYSPVSKKIKKVAVCGGAGSFLVKAALSLKADAFITSDMKYHEFFDAEAGLMICDIGHFESEKFTIEIFAQVLGDKYPNFALLFSDVNTNPIKYYS